MSGDGNRKDKYTLKNFRIKKNRNGKLAGDGPGIRVFKIREITCWYVGC